MGYRSAPPPRSLAAVVILCASVVACGCARRAPAEANPFRPMTERPALFTRADALLETAHGAVDELDSRLDDILY